MYTNKEKNNGGYGMGDAGGLAPTTPCHQWQLAISHPNFLLPFLFYKFIFLKKIKYHLAFSLILLLKVICRIC